MKVWCSFVVLSLLPACYEQPTRVIAALAAESGVADAATSIRVRVSYGEVEFRDEIIEEPTWPRLIVVEPLASEPTSDYVLTIDAFDHAGEPIASIALRSGFVSEETRFVRLALALGCGEVELAADALSLGWSAPVAVAEPCTGWSASEAIATAATGDARAPVVGATGQGRAIVAWHQEDAPNEFGFSSQIYTRWFDSVGWQAPERLALEHMQVVSAPVLVADRNGGANVLWQVFGDDSIATLARRFDGEVWAGFALAHSASLFVGSSWPPLHVGARSGAALAVWEQRTGRSGSWSTSNRFLDGQWGEPVGIPVGGSLVDFADRPDGAIDDDGNALVVWAHPILFETPDGLGPADSHVAASRLDRAATAWEPPVILDSGEPMGPAFVAMENDGDSALAVWARGSRQRFSRYDSQAGWSSPQEVPSDLSIGVMRIDDEGNVLSIAQPGAAELVSTHFDAVRGAWAELGRIDAAEGGEIAELDFALEPGGRGVAVWVETAGITRALWSAVYSPATGWESAARLEPSAAGDPSSPRVAIDEQGHAFVVWEHTAEGVTQLRAACRSD